MSDPIDRQAAIDAICTEGTRLERKGTVAMAEIKQWCVDILEALPSAQPEPCEDAVSRNAIIQKLNTMDRYVSEELILCDTDKRFPKNEVFIVDDVYEEIVENLPSAQPDIIHCRECIHAIRDGLSGGLWCKGKVVTNYHYCGYAERRTEE